MVDHPTITLDPATGMPINPATGMRYGAVERHPFVLTPNVAERGHVCHVCNGAPDYIAHAPAPAPVAVEATTPARKSATSPLIRRPVDRGRAPLLETDPMPTPLLDRIARVNAGPCATLYRGVLCARPAGHDGLCRSDRGASFIGIPTSPFTRSALAGTLPAKVIR